jgi:transposase
VPAIPSWLLEPLWDQPAALLPARPVYDPARPLGCRRRRIPDRIVFEKLVQVLRFGCSYEAIAGSSCSATTSRARRDEWIKGGIFAGLKQIALEAYDRMTGLILQELASDGCITKAPGGGECAGRSLVDRGKQGMKRSLMVDGYGIPLDRVLAGANRHDSRCCPPPWTNSPDSARCRSRSGSTSTPGTTPGSPATSWRPGQ